MFFPQRSLQVVVGVAVFTLRFVRDAGRGRMGEHPADCRGAPPRDLAVLGAMGDFQHEPTDRCSERRS